MAADVDDQAALGQIDLCLDPAHLAVQVLDHAAVEAGTVTVVVAVHGAELVRVPQLHEAAHSLAADALDELQRAHRHRLLRTAREDASERLHAEVQDLHQLAGCRRSGSAEFLYT